MLSEEEKKKAFADLYSPLENHLMFSKSAYDIVANYNYIEILGRQILVNNMNYCKNNLKLESFDPDNPYEDYDLKNMYFSAANNLCQFSLWRQGLYTFAERYYRALLAEIKKFEKTNDFNHNKGMAYANLGISQAIQLKIDEGFANILKALDEDKGYFKHGNKPTEEFFKTPLFTQLEKVLILNHLEKQINTLTTDGESCPSSVGFLNGLTESDQRIFFEYTFAKIMDNYRVWNEKPNRFSANRMIAYLQDLCLFAEDFLKRKGHAGTLGGLITSAFPGVDVRCGANSYDELNQKLEELLKETNKRDRALRILLTLRNFSSHNISAGESNDFILSEFEKVIKEVFRAIINIFQLPSRSAHP